MWNREQLSELITTQLGNRKFIVVSNREPYIHRYSAAGIECVCPASGMTTAIDPLMMASGGTWIAHGSGDADAEVVDARDSVPVPPENPSYRLRRVWLTRQEEEGYYYGLANRALWPLCHVTFTRPHFDESDWNTYRRVNEKFADAVIEEAAGEPAVVFIQDYHFCLLSKMLKERGGDLRVMQFFHIPWPNHEMLRPFPWKEELIEGMLGNDLLGFHIRYHCQNFLSTVDRFLEAKIDQEQSEVVRGGHSTMVRPFPISIDAQSHAEKAVSPEITSRMDHWRKRLRLGDRMLGLGIERLDYTKGIPERLKGYERFLQDHPDAHGNIVFLQIAVPSRSHIDEYQEIEEEVDDIVEKINWKYGRSNWQPVVLIKEHQKAEEMMALHRLARFMVVSSLHDGMNLVAKEFVMSREDEAGVLILSRFTGAYRELEQAVGINPFAIHEIAQAIELAAVMPHEDQTMRMKRMREQVLQNNVYRWAGKCLLTLLRMSDRIEP